MCRPVILAWVLSVGSALRRSQAKTLAELVAAAVPTERVSLANLGRAMGGAARCKHRIKRAARFVANRRVSVADGMAGVIARLTRRRAEPLVVALDWVQVRTFHTLVAAAVAGGRSVPLVWASYPEWELFRSQNSLEEGLVRLLRSLVPDRVRLILLADRGFGRAAFAHALAGMTNVAFVVRIKPDVHVRHPRFTGKLLDYPVRKGVRRVLRGVAYRSDRATTVNVVIRWKKGLPGHRDGPWFLLTNLGKGSAVALTRLYARRMGIEEFFRDGKSVRNGFALRHTQVSTAERFDRLVLVLVLAYLLLTGLGLRAMAAHRPGEWCSRDKGTPCSAAVVGRTVRGWLHLSPTAAVAAVLAATLTAGANWG